MPIPTDVYAKTVYAVIVKQGVGRDAVLSLHEQQEDAQYAYEMATQLARVLHGDGEQVCRVHEIEMEMRTAVVKEVQAPKRRARDYHPEFEQWWEGQSPKRRKDDVYDVCCSIKRTMVEREGTRWDFIGCWNEWISDGDQSGSVLERVQRFREEVVNGRRCEEGFGSNETGREQHEVAGSAT